MRRSAIFATSAILAATSQAHAEDPSITAEASVRPGRIGPGERAKLAIDIDIPDGWHLWSLDPGEGPSPLRIRLPEGSPIAFSGAWSGPEPHAVFDRGFNRELKQYAGAPVRLERIVELGPDAKPGASVATVEIRGQICTDETCLMQRLGVPFAIEVAAEPTGAPPVELAGVLLTSAPESKPSSAARAATPATAATQLAPSSPLEQAKRDGILAFLLLAFVAGLGALATPCVFPAIPMTVSFFQKFSQRSFGHSARLAAFYAIAMMLYFTAAGMAVSIVFGVAGIQRFAAHPAFNVGLGLVLVFFALNLLGWFEIAVPQWMLNFTNKLEWRWGPAAQASGVDRPEATTHSVLRDYIAVGVAAMTATTVFFTCTVAFVGVVLVAAAQGEWFWPTLGMLAFSGAFVLPFFLLALFPNAAMRMRGRGGNWLIATRVTLGFIELAAALKFFSNADLVWRTNLISRDAVLALWISLFALCGLFLLGKIRFGEAPPAEEGEHISVPRLLVATSTFAFTIYLAVALFAGRPLGGWVDGWLPPQDLAGISAPVAPDGSPSKRASFTWIHDLDEGRRVAAERGTLVFVNYTGFTCTNCRYMESGVFPLPEIAPLLHRMTLVELYTDGLAPEHERNRDDQLQRFKTAALPFYVVELADGTVLATFPSSTNDPQEFRRFLESAMERAPPAGSEKAEAVAANASVVLKTTRLVDGAAEPAIVPGKWTLVNFWATWCGPCKIELKEFVAKMGRELEARGGRFAAVAVEEEDTIPAAREFMAEVGVPPGSALRLPGEPAPSDVDPRIGFTGGELPYTVLVSPQGEVVWKHSSKLEPDKLKAVLTEYTGLAALP